MSAARATLAACALALLAACAQEPRGDAAREPASPSGFDVPADMAALYVFNDSRWTLFPKPQSLSDGGRPFLTVRRGTWTRLLIGVGPHHFRPEPYLWRQEVRLDAKAGESYYVVVGYRPERAWPGALADSPVVFVQIGEDDARALMGEMRRR